MPTSLKKSEILDSLVNEIKNQENYSNWYLSSSDIIEITGLGKEQYHREIYKYFSHSGKIPDGFHNTEIFDLIKFMTVIFFDKSLSEAEMYNLFAKEGIYLSEALCQKVENFFCDYYNYILLSHKFDKDLLLILASATEKFSDAFETYIDDAFDIESIIRRAVVKFMTTESIDSEFGADDFLISYIKNKIMKKSISIKKLYEEFMYRTFYDLFGENLDENDKKVNNSKIYPDAEKFKLLEFFGLKEGDSKKELKSIYQKLLKKYHPDINKEGLEQTKIIIEKYNRLKVIMK